MFDYIVVCHNSDSPNTGFAARVRAVVSEIRSSGKTVLVIRFAPIFRSRESWRGVWGADSNIKLVEIPSLPISRSQVIRGLSIFLSSYILNVIVKRVQPLVVQCECYESAAIALGIDFAGSLYADIHGATPEEMEYFGRGRGWVNEKLIHWFNSVERDTVRNFDKLIVVSENMVSHLEEKVRVVLGNKAEVVPIFPDGSFFKPIDKELCRKHFGLTGRVVFLYSGGMQKYQCIDETIEWFRLIKMEMPESYLLIFTPDVEAAKLKVEGILGQSPLDVAILSVEKERLSDYISAADFGFVLREDEVLNTVSSPTKAVEYLSRGVRLVCTKSSGSAFNYANNFKAGVVVPLKPSASDVDFVVADIRKALGVEVPVDLIQAELSRDGYLDALQRLYGKNHV